MQKEKQIVGRLEHVDFPDLEMSGLDAKIDTGAYSSALHCSRIWVDDEGILHFIILDEDHPEFKDQPITMNEFDTVSVRSSSGEQEERYKIRLRVRLGKRRIKAIFTLTNRSEMKYPVLLGRRLLKNRFIVDVDQSYLMDEQS